MNKMAYTPPNLPISWVLSYYYCHTRARRRHPLTNGFICGKRYAERRHSVRFATLYSARVHPRACMYSHSAHTRNALHAPTHTPRTHIHASKHALKQYNPHTHISTGLYIHAKYTYTNVHVYICMYVIHAFSCMGMCMGWLRLVGSLKLQVSFAEYSLFYRALLQKRPIILRSLIVGATPQSKMPIYILERQVDRRSSVIVKHSFV